MNLNGKDTDEVEGSNSYTRGDTFCREEGRDSGGELAWERGKDCAVGGLEPSQPPEARRRETSRDDGLEESLLSGEGKSQLPPVKLLPLRDNAASTQRLPACSRERRLASWWLSPLLAAQDVLATATRSGDLQVCARHISMRPAVVAAVREME